MTYTPPTNRTEAVEEVMHTGFTTSACIAIGLAFPLPGEIEQTVHDELGQRLLADYADHVCFYLHAWGRNASRVSSPSDLHSVSVGKNTETED